jgi:hypothetical protein
VDTAFLRMLAQEKYFNIGITALHSIMVEDISSSGKTMISGLRDGSRLSVV